MERVPTSPITIVTSEGGGACGYNFENGGEYIVYAYGEEAPFNTSICTRTQSFADAYEDLAYLGEGYIPVAGQPVAEKTPSSPFLPFIGIGAVVAGIIAYIMLRGRRA